MNPKQDHVIDYFSFTRHSDQKVEVARRGAGAETRTFCFQDEVWYLWDLLRPHEYNDTGTIVFSKVAPWLREDAKLYIAHLWLRIRPTAIQIQKTMVAIRHLGRLLPDFAGRVIDLRLRHAREFSRHYGELGLKPITNQGTRRFLNRFVIFIRQLHPEVKDNDFRIELPKAQTLVSQYQPLEQNEGARVPTDVLAQVIDACTTDTNAYFEAIKDYVDVVDNPREYFRQYTRKKKQGLFPRPKRMPVVRHLLSRAVKAQAVILAICVGRRPAAVCNTGYDVKTSKYSWTNDAGQPERGVMVRFREMKIRNVDEDVPCPDAFGDLALKALKTAKELTAELRRHNPEWGDYLFLVPSMRRKRARVITLRQINTYLNGHKKSLGIRQRYNIPGGTITTHNFRATRATNMWLGGLAVHEVSYDLGHASAEMTIRHYIVGKDESRRRFQQLMDHGALSGALEEIVGGRGGERIRLDERRLEIMRKQGRYITPTHYGGCDLALSSGDCPMSYACYTGSGDDGGGCIHHVLTPDALPALEDDRRAIEEQISAYGADPSYRVVVENQTNQLRVVESTIMRARDLQVRLDACRGDLCRCKRIGQEIV